MTHRVSLVTFISFIPGILYFVFRANERVSNDSVDTVASYIFFYLTREKLVNRVVLLGVVKKRREKEEKVHLFVYIFSAKLDSKILSSVVSVRIYLPQCPLSQSTTKTPLVQLSLTSSLCSLVRDWFSQRWQSARLSATESRRNEKLFEIEETGRAAFAKEGADSDLLRK